MEELSIVMIMEKFKLSREDAIELLKTTTDKSNDIIDKKKVTNPNDMNVSDFDDIKHSASQKLKQINTKNQKNKKSRKSKNKK